MRIGALFFMLSQLLWGYSADIDFTEKFEKQSVYGKWVDIDRGRIIEINSKSNFSFERLDNDLIILVDGKQKNYLKRIGVAKTAVTGRVVLDPQGIVPLRNGDVLLIHQNDSTISARAKTDAKGYFTNETLPSGAYRLSVREGKASINIPVTLKNAKEELGTFVLKTTKEANFKSELDWGDTYVVSNTRPYAGILRIRNYGQSDATVCYEVSMQDSDLKSLDAPASCKKVSASSHIEVPIRMSFNPIAINSQTKKLQVKLQEGTKQPLLEMHEFTVFKNLFTMKVNTPLDAIKVYVILPGHDLLEVNSKTSSIDVPKLSDQEYQLIIANADPRQKTTYVVDIGAEEKLIKGDQETSTPSRRRGGSKKPSPFKLKQSIGRYPDIGDIAIYTFTIADGIELNEDDAPVRIPFVAKNELGDIIDYDVTITNEKLAHVDYTKGVLTVTPKKDANGKATIILRNKTGVGYSKKNQKLFTLTVAPVNDLPIITSTPPTQAIEGKVYSYYLKATDLESKNLKKSALKLPKWLKFNPNNGQLYGTPKASDEGKHEVVLNVKDHRESVQQRFSITVTALARAPKVGESFFQLQEDTTLEAKLIAKARERVTFALLTKPKHGKVTLLSNGTFTYIPKRDFYGEDVFTYEATSNGKSSQATVTLTVMGVNDAPQAHDATIENVGALPVRLAWEELFKVYDADEDVLTITMTKPPRLGALRIEEEMLIYTPFADTKGEDSARLVISDANGGTVEVMLTFKGVERHLTPRILQTGQKVIYYKFDDAIYKKSLPRSYRYDLNKTVIVDEVMQLSWLVAPSTPMPYAHAKETCESLIHAGLDSWRLPTVDELVLLSDKGRKLPAVDPLFTHIKNGYYWSSTAYPSREFNQWVVFMGTGEDYYGNVYKSYEHICVRDGINLNPALIEANVTADTNTTIEANVTITPPRFHAHDDVVEDVKTELMWYDGQLMDESAWIAAIRQCEELKFAGFDDWRMPNFNELYSITVHDGSRPAMPSVFTSADTHAYWSSTSSDHDHDRAWGISFYKGSDFTYDKAEELRLRCVRDLK